jgi:hypothetical protein
VSDGPLDSILRIVTTLYNADFILRCDNTLAYYNARQCSPQQGCQIVYFQNKNPNSGNFKWKMVSFLDIWSTYFMGILSIYVHLVYFVAILYIFPRFIILYQEKSGNRAPYVGSCNCSGLATCF